MEHDEFERELSAALEWQPAPPGLKSKILARRRLMQEQRRHARVIWWQKLAASVLLAAAAGGAWVWHNAEERRRGEAARQQVLTALRIANHAFDVMNAQLQERNRETR